MVKMTKDELIDAISELSVMDLSELVKALEEKFGVSATPMAVAQATAPAEASAEEGPKEEQTTFNVVLANAGANKLGAIKAVREVVPTLGLAEAKALVESAPKNVLEGVNKATAEEAKKKLEASGATVELK